jgi:hypothetical protein
MSESFILQTYPFREADLVASFFARDWRHCVLVFRLTLAFGEKDLDHDLVPAVHLQAPSPAFCFPISVVPNFTPLKISDRWQE